MNSTTARCMVSSTGRSPLAHRPGPCWDRRGGGRPLASSSNRIRKAVRLDAARGPSPEQPPMNMAANRAGEGKGAPLPRNSELAKPVVVMIDMKFEGRLGQCVEEAHVPATRRR